MKKSVQLVRDNLNKQKVVEVFYLKTHSQSSTKKTVNEQKDILPREQTDQEKSKWMNDSSASKNRKTNNKAPSLATEESQGEAFATQKLERLKRWKQQ